MIFIPSEIWSKILKHVDIDQRITLCKILIESGTVKIEKSIFHTYMILLEESRENDNILNNYGFNTPFTTN